MSNIDIIFSEQKRQTNSFGMWSQSHFCREGLEIRSVQLWRESGRRSWGIPREGQMGAIRIAARALIMHKKCLLLTRCEHQGHTFYLAPGGGQEERETLAETVARECREEIGVEVEGGRLLFVRDYIPPKGGFSYLSKEQHQVEHFFECRVPDDYRPTKGSTPDSNQVAVEWLDLETLSKVEVYPAWLVEVLGAKRVSSLPFYWGDRR